MTPDERANQTVEQWLILCRRIVISDETAILLQGHIARAIREAETAAKTEEREVRRQNDIEWAEKVKRAQQYEREARSVAYERGKAEEREACAAIARSKVEDCVDPDTRTIGDGELDRAEVAAEIEGAIRARGGDDHE